MANDSNEPNKQIKSQQAPASSQKTSLSNRAAGLIIIFVLAGIFWIYGYAGQIRYAETSKYPTTGLANFPTGTQTQSLLGNLYIIDSIFVVIGFGLLFTYFKKSTFSGLLIVIYTVSITVLISPILEKFWFNVFITNFQGTANLATDPSRLYQYSLGGLHVYLDYYNLRIALANAISQLVVILALFGKLNAIQIVINSIGFNFLWNLNHFLCAYLASISPDNRFFDDYQISNVYLFAACYGIAVSFILRNPKTQQVVEFSNSQNTAVTAHLGTFFLFLSFCATTTMFTLKSSISVDQSVRTYLWQEAFLSIFIALSASIIFTYSFSILFNPHSKIGIRGSLIGTISGAIMYGSVAGTCINIGASIAVGLIAGLISAVFFQKIYPKINGEQIRDSYGLISILIISFLGTFVIAPTVLKTYYNYNVNLPTLYPQGVSTSTSYISNKDTIGWILVYVGVSMGIGLFSGIFISLLLKISERILHKYFDDSDIFRIGAFGLRNKQIKNNVEIAPSAQNLKQ